MPIDPVWVAEEPRLTAVLRASAPACTAREHFFKGQDANLAHAYTIRAPSLARADQEQRFRDAAKELGFTVGPDPGGSGLAFRDQAKRISGSVGEAFVTVIVGNRADARQRAARLAAQHRMETWGLVAALGEDQVSEVAFDRTSDSTSFTVRTVLPSGKRATLDAWVREHGLDLVDRTWVRKLSPYAPEVSAIMVRLDSSNVSVMEMRYAGQPLPSVACQEHPSRKAPAPAASPRKESDEELIRQMMGK